jgi:pSer/pThr/pTyr-binding forkhead associated (FHA) protein
MKVRMNYLDEAAHRSREEFARTHPYFFLVASSSAPETRDAFGQVDDGERTRTTNPQSSAKVSLPMVFAVRKVQTAFPSMITVGRTSNNDLVIPDPDVSRFHAYFHVMSDRVELGDAGSANGTFLDGRKLPPKGPIQIVIPGTRVRFAHYEFHFIDADGAWHLLRSR